MLKNILSFFGLTKESKLMKAAEKGNVQQIKNYLDQGINPNAKNKDGFTALMTAAYESHTDIVQALVEAGAGVNARSQAGSAALMASASKGDTVQCKSYWMRELISMPHIMMAQRLCSWRHSMVTPI